MIKVMAALRTLFLIFIVVFAVRATPLLVGLPSDINEPYAVCKTSNDRFARVVWFAVGWIGFETAVGWWMSSRETRRAKRAAAPAPATGAPPLTPPPR